MRIAIYTLTRDRLLYTQHCFAALKERAGLPYDHFVVDNGSEDGTTDWLREQEDGFAGVVYNDHNKGIAIGCNQALDAMGSGYDLIIKMDNDCEVLTSGILGHVAEAYEPQPGVPPELLLSPRVEGIVNQPARHGVLQIGRHTVGLTNHVGGLFQALRGPTYQAFRFNKKLPLARGADANLSSWFAHNQKGATGYLEDIAVAHFETTDGQAKRFPEYFRRKNIEHSMPYDPKRQI